MFSFSNPRTFPRVGYTQVCGIPRRISLAWQSRKILADILAGVPADEQAKIAGGNTARVYGFDVARSGRP